MQGLVRVYQQGRNGEREMTKDQESMIKHLSRNNGDYWTAERLARVFRNTEVKIGDIREVIEKQKSENKK
jgi:hypothetical protein